MRIIPVWCSAMAMLDALIQPAFEDSHVPGGPSGKFRNLISDNAATIFKNSMQKLVNDIHQVRFCFSNML
jgi:hypothetical protein